MSQKISLSKPIEAHGEKVRELNLKEPTLGALEGIKLSVSGEGKVEIDLGDIPKIIANMADIPPSSARQISFKDMKQFVGVIQGFLSDFLETGKT